MDHSVSPIRLDRMFYDESQYFSHRGDSKQNSVRQRAARSEVKAEINMSSDEDKLSVAEEYNYHKENTLAHYFTQTFHQNTMETPKRPRKPSSLISDHPIPDLNVLKDTNIHGSMTQKLSKTTKLTFDSPGESMLVICSPFSYSIDKETTIDLSKSNQRQNSVYVAGEGTPAFKSNIQPPSFREKSRSDYYGQPLFNNFISSGPSPSVIENLVLPPYIQSHKTPAKQSRNQKMVKEGSPCETHNTHNSKQSKEKQSDISSIRPKQVGFSKMSQNSEEPDILKRIQSQMQRKKKELDTQQQKNYQSNSMHNSMQFTFLMKQRFKTHRDKSNNSDQSDGTINLVEQQRRTPSREINIDQVSSISRQVLTPVSGKVIHISPVKISKQMVIDLYQKQKQMMNQTNLNDQEKVQTLQKIVDTSQITGLSKGSIMRSSKDRKESSQTKVNDMIHRMEQDSKARQQRQRYLTQFQGMSEAEIQEKNRKKMKKSYERIQKRAQYSNGSRDISDLIMTTPPRVIHDQMYSTASQSLKQSQIVLSNFGNLSQAKSRAFGNQDQQDCSALEPKLKLLDNENGFEIVNDNDGIYDQI